MCVSGAGRDGEGYVRKSFTCMPKRALSEKGFEDAPKDGYAEKKP